MATDGYVLGIDYGEKRVGLALAHTIAQMPRPFTTLQAEQDVLAEIQRVIREESVQQIVLGLPRNMDGSLGFQAASVEAFGKQLSEVCDVPLEYVEETLSTVDADQAGSGKQQHGIDARAAAVILQRYFEERRVKEHI